MCCVCVLVMSVLDDKQILEIDSGDSHRESPLHDVRLARQAGDKSLLRHRVKDATQPHSLEHELLSPSVAGVGLN